MNLQFAVQPSPDGLAQASNINEQFLASTLVLICSLRSSTAALE